MDNSNYIKFLHQIVKTIEKDKLTSDQTAGLIKVIEQVPKSKTPISRLLPKNEAEQEELNTTFDLLDGLGLLRSKTKAV